MSYADEARTRDYRTVFGTPEGERVLADLIDLNGLLRPTFNADAQVAAFNEGRRNVVLDILRFLNVTPEQVRDLAANMGEKLDD